MAFVAYLLVVQMTPVFSRKTLMQPVMSGYVTMVMVKKRQHVSVSNVKHIFADSVFLSTMYRKQLCTENSYVQKTTAFYCNRRTHM